MLPSDSAAGASAVQLPSLSVKLSAAAAGLSAGPRRAVHPAVQVYMYNTGWHDRAWLSTCRV